MTVSTIKAKWDYFQIGCCTTFRTFCTGQKFACGAMTGFKMTVCIALNNHKNRLQLGVI